MRGVRRFASLISNASTVFRRGVYLMMEKANRHVAPTRRDGGGGRGICERAHLLIEISRDARRGGRQRRGDDASISRGQSRITEKFSAAGQAAGKAML